MRNHGGPTPADLRAETKDHGPVRWPTFGEPRSVTVRAHGGRASGLSFPDVVPLRLNLGCGGRKLDGYVNIDVVQQRGDSVPDIVADVADLSRFPERCVDEILAVHVVEHFWRWEVLEVLKGWVRLLKPGGKMILECPNLVSACQVFLDNPEAGAGAGKEGQRTMWVFYGDPAWRDPLMVHRWGYTPKSLAQLMFKAGLKELRQEPAQFKLREPRDMRVTGIRPLV